MTTVLIVQGVKTKSFTQSDLAQRDDRIEIATRDDKRSGTAVPLLPLLEEVGIPEFANQLTLCASTDEFSATLPFPEAAEAGLIWFAGTQPLTAREGGPFRFLIPNAAACRTAVLDTCANVKLLDRITLH